MTNLSAFNWNRCPLSLECAIGIPGRGNAKSTSKNLIAFERKPDRVGAERALHYSSEESSFLSTASIFDDRDKIQITPKTSGSFTSKIFQSKGSGNEITITAIVAMYRDCLRVLLAGSPDLIKYKIALNSHTIFISQSTRVYPTMCATMDITHETSNQPMIHTFCRARYFRAFIEFISFSHHRS